MSILVEHVNRLLEAYSNYPVGRYVGLVIVRKTESEVLFRTEGAGEDLTKEFVHAGVTNDTPIFRVVMTKRKQTAVERRTGRSSSTSIGWRPCRCRIATAAPPAVR